MYAYVMPYTSIYIKYWVSAVWLVKAERKVKHIYAVRKTHIATGTLVLRASPLRMQKARRSKRGLVECIYSPHTVLGHSNMPSTVYRKKFGNFV